MGKKKAVAAVLTPTTPHTDHKKCCHEMVVKIHTPNAEKCETSKKLIEAKEILDIELGLKPSKDGTLIHFGVEPFGTSNIIGTFIRQKTKDGKPTGQFCIKVLVKQKPPQGKNLFSSKIRTEVNGIPTDVVALGSGVRHFSDAVGNPVIGGLPGGLERGTIGALVDCGEANQFILSNQHVLNPGFQSNEGNPILNAGHQQIGTLRAWSSDGNPDLDAALGEVVPGTISSLYDGGSVQLNPDPMTEDDVLAAAKATGGYLVKKFGANGMTIGTISPDSPFRDVPSDGTKYRRQWMIMASDGGKFSDHGDSGSLVMGMDNNRPIGLLWGGDDFDETISYANRILEVKTKFGIEKFL